MSATEAFITSLGVFLPNDPVNNDRIEDVLGQVNRTSTAVKRRVLINNGIVSRYYAIDPTTGEQTHTNAQLTAEAVRSIAHDVDFHLDDISCLACGTSSADQIIPNHASMVQAELGCGPCDLAATSGVCCSGVSALKYGYSHVALGMGKNSVVTGSELASVTLRATHFQPELDLKRADLEKEPKLAFRNDFLRWMLSDGAGAMLIEPAPRNDSLSLRIDWIDILSYASETDVCMYGGMKKCEDGSIVGFRSVTDPLEWCRDGYFSLSQDVDILQERLPALMKKAIAVVRDKHNLSSDHIDWLAPHYSSKWFRQPLYDGIADLNLEIPFEKWFTNLPTKGNIGAASIYIILEELVHSGRLKRGDRILCIVPESARMTFGFFHLTTV